MKIRVIFLLILMFATLRDASAQVQYSPTLDLYMGSGSGGLWFDRSNAFLDSMIKGQMQQQQMLMFNQMMLDQMIKEEAGKQKITAGKATTKFAPSPQNSVAEQFAANGKTAQEKQEIKQTVSLALQTYNDALKRKRLTSNDLADEEAFSFVLSYIAYKDEDPGDARLLKLRNSLRAQIIKSNFIQGLTDAEKQKQSESRAFRTMLAIKAYQQSKRTDISATEKQNAGASAKKYAESVLKELWTGNVAGIELSETSSGFSDKGERLVKSGASGTSFVRSEKSTWAEKNAFCFKGDSSTIVKGDIGCFYDKRERFDRELTALGGANNDLAYANAVAFKFAYQAYTSGRIVLNEKQFRWVLDEMRKDIKGSAAFQSLSDAQKQESYDSLVFTSMNVYDTYKFGADALKNNTQDDLTVKILAGNKLRYAQEDSIKVLRNIFTPRNFDSYELRADGFVKIK